MKSPINDVLKTEKGMLSFLYGIKISVGSIIQKKPASNAARYLSSIKRAITTSYRASKKRAELYFKDTCQKN